MPNPNEQFEKSLVNENAGDDIPFTSQTGDGAGNPVLPPDIDLKPDQVAILKQRIKQLLDERDSLSGELDEVKEALQEEQHARETLITKDRPSVAQRDIFLAIVTGMASNGDFTVGSKLNSDDSIRNAARHAAGVSSFFLQAAREARI